MLCTWGVAYSLTDNISHHLTGQGLWDILYLPSEPPLVCCPCRGDSWTLATPAPWRIGESLRCALRILQILLFNKNKGFLNNSQISIFLIHINICACEYEWDVCIWKTLSLMLLNADAFWWRKDDLFRPSMRPYYLFKYVFMHLCIFAFMCVCLYVSMYVRTYVCQ